MRMRLGWMSFCALLALATSAQAAPLQVHSIQPLSGKTPFTACPFDAPPPFTESEWQPQDTAVEPHIAIDPKRPRRMAVAWMQDFTQGIIVAYSRDGGATWTRSIPPKLSECTGHAGASADPRLSFGPDGTLYMSSMRNIGLSPGRTVPDNEVAVSVSPNGGRTWRDPVVVQGRDGYNDFPMVAADPERAGRVYVSFTKATEPVANALFTMFAVSEDGGRTFSAPKAIHRATDMAVYGSIGSIVAQRDGGVLLLLWNFDGLNYLPEVPDLTTTKIRAISSSDGGKTWRDPVLVGEQTPVYNATDPETGESLRTGAPDAAPAADGGWFVVWHDIEGSRARLNLAHGRADGTWEAPREVLPWAERQIFLPMVAQTPEGTLGLMWLDSRADRPDDGRYLIDAYFAASRDGGSSFSELHLAGPMDLRGAWADARTLTGTGQRFLGDYAGLAARPHGFAGAIPFTAPVAEVGKSQLFVADVRERASRRPSRKRRR